MPQAKNRDFFYVDSSHVTNGVLKLTGGEAHHIHNVFRKKKGDIIWAVNGKGTAYETNILDFGDDTVTCKIDRTYQEFNEPELELKLGLGNAEIVSCGRSIEQLHTAWINGTCPFEQFPFGEKITEQGKTRKDRNRRDETVWKEQVDQYRRSDRVNPIHLGFIRN